VGRVFFPLDQELALLPGDYTPTLVEDMVRLGARIEFGPAAAEIGRLKKVHVSKPTVRRDTEKAGDAYVVVQTEQLAALEKELPPAPLGPPLQQLSVDGVMVPLLHGEWGEVKSLAIGTIGAPVLEKGEWVVHTTDLTYFSRLVDHETFTRAATVETHRRGTETAGTVCAINDGAEWEQKLVDHHRPDAVRILDWGHSSEYVADAGHAVFGKGTAAASEWLGQQLHELKHGDPPKVLAELRRLCDVPTVGERELSSEAVKVVRTSLDYLEKRQAMIRYAEFTAAGYPIGSGAIESGNKLVIERRLKGPGMHWAREHVDGMAALRNALCSDRWDEAWTELSARWRQTVRERAAHRRGKRREVANAVRAVPIPSLTKAATRPKPVVAPVDGHLKPVASSVAIRPPAGPRRPAANHPWRHSPIGQARYTRASLPCSTET
jgi:hypothetical protein